MKAKYYSHRRRMRKAYGTAWAIFWSYYRLKLTSRLLGQAYYRRRIERLHQRNAQRLQRTILELEGLFVKVGQLLSILTNFLPKAYHAPLNALQDRVPARPIHEIEQRITAALGRPIGELFADFDPKPLATASIGQAHRATLPDGQPVVVKVQHFNIERIASVDLRIIERLTRIASRYFEIKGIEYAYQQIRLMIEDELNFAQEADSMERVAASLAGTPRFLIPKVHRDLSTERVLVTSFCEGVNIAQLQQLDEWGIDRTDLAERLISIFVQMVLRDGFYHADPHPGNILVQADGTIVLIDFGAVAHVQPNLRVGIPRLIEAVAKNDTAATLKALRDMDFLSDNPDNIKVAERLILAFREFIEEEVQVDGLDFKNLQNVNPFETSLFKIQLELGAKTIANTFQIPKDYVLLNRTATLLLGICSALDPSLNPLTVVRPHIQRLIQEERGDLSQVIWQSAKRSLRSTIALPETLNQFLRKAERGDLTIQQADAHAQMKLQYAQSQQLRFTLLCIAAIAIGIWLHELHYLPYARLAGLVALWSVYRSTQAGRTARKILILRT